MRLIDADELYKVFTECIVAVSTGDGIKINKDSPQTAIKAFIACREAVENAPTVKPEAVKSKGTQDVPLEDDADIQEIVQEYTIKCIKLLEKNISDTVLHAVEENKKLKEEIAELKKQIENQKNNAISVEDVSPVQAAVKSYNSTLYDSLVKQSINQRLESLHYQINSQLVQTCCNYGDHK